MGAEERKALNTDIENAIQMHMHKLLDFFKKDTQNLFKLSFENKQMQTMFEKTNDLSLMKKIIKEELT